MQKLNIKTYVHVSNSIPKLNAYKPVFFFQIPREVWMLGS
jgi:hypothetical protein